jgi:hypothetical protein
MKRPLRDARTAQGWLLLLFAMACARSAAGAADICQDIGDGQLRCTIASLADCRLIRNYPYARNLFCPAAYSAVQRVVASLAGTLQPLDRPTGSFHYFQTLPDASEPSGDPSQTSTPCMDTAAPYSALGAPVVGAGLPLCHLIAHATSPGPVRAASGTPGGNPVPDRLRSYPRYFTLLFAPNSEFPLTGFRTGSVFDRVVKALGASGYDGFVADYPEFSTSALYDPADWQNNPYYAGFSGGGGGGWGGEIAVRRPDGSLATLLAFGGGGGGGMTSLQPGGGKPPSATLGAGGGGGMQFANAYRFRQRAYNGLGLGAGMGSDQPQAQYSYNDYAGSGRPPRPVHRYNPAVIADYTAQLAHLAEQLRARLKAGGAVVISGGGGMGSGTEYLRRKGEEYVPHALSTQAAFQFAYTFGQRQPSEETAAETVAGETAAAQQDLYKFLGDAYRKANRQAYLDCGRNYADYACICPKAHGIVICLVGQRIGAGKKIPAWIQQQHCPTNGGTTSIVSDGLTPYQHLLLGSLPAALSAVQNDPATDGPGGCNSVLKEYFEALNTPASQPD